MNKFGLIVLCLFVLVFAVSVSGKDLPSSASSIAQKQDVKDDDKGRNKRAKNRNKKEEEVKSVAQNSDSVDIMEELVKLLEGKFAAASGDAAKENKVRKGRVSRRDRDDARVVNADFSKNTGKNSKSLMRKFEKTAESLLTPKDFFLTPLYILLLAVAIFIISLILMLRNGEAPYKFLMFVGVVILLWSIYNLLGR